MFDSSLLHVFLERGSYYAEVVALRVHEYPEILIRFIVSGIEGRSILEQPLHLNCSIIRVEVQVQSDPAFDFFRNLIQGDVWVSSLRVSKDNKSVLGRIFGDIVSISCQNASILSKSLQSITIEPISRCKTLLLWRTGQY